MLRWPSFRSTFHKASWVLATALVLDAFLPVPISWTSISDSSRPSAPGDFSRVVAGVLCVLACRECNPGIENPPDRVQRLGALDEDLASRSPKAQTSERATARNAH